MKISHETVKELLDQGYGDKKIGEMLGCSHSHIKHIRVYHLGVVSLRDQRKKEKSEIIKNLYDQGLNDAQIGEATGFSHSTVQYHRKNLLNLDAYFEEKTYGSEYDRVRGYIIRNVKFSAKRRDIEFSICYRDFDLPEYCPLLGVKLTYRGDGDFNGNDRATLDRIDNSKGYIPGNVWVLSRLANTMKNEATNEQLHIFCQNILSMLENQRARGGITDSESLDP
jgi:DNA-binding CsgD family transcriptional regulator